MIELFLDRTLQDANGSFGTLMFQDDDNAVQQIAYTCEPPPPGAGVFECIPPGRYRIARHDSPAHPHTWELQGVPARYGVLIHVGNTVKDTKGCILIGLAMGVLDGLPAVLHSADAMAKLNRLIPENGCWLTVG